MNTVEVHAGLRRMGLAALGLLGVALLLTLVFVGFGATLAEGAAAGLGIVGIGLVVCGVVAFTGTRSVRKANGAYVQTDPNDRLDAEKLSFGLLLSGVLFCAAALLIG